MLYTVAIEAGDDVTSYGVAVPDLPGCYSAGDTLEEALANAKEAICLHLTDLAEQGELPPLPTPLSNLIRDEEFKGWSWAHVEIDETAFLGKSSKVNVTLPDLLTLKIDKFVKDHPSYGNRSRFLQLAALREIEGLHA